MIAFNNRDKVFNVLCKLCGSSHSIFLNEQNFDDWQNGDCYIQDCLEYLTASERELLISAERAALALRATGQGTSGAAGSLTERGGGPTVL
jgi:hypothetical protein